MKMDIFSLIRQAKETEKELKKHTVNPLAEALMEMAEAVDRGDEEAAKEATRRADEVLKGLTRKNLSYINLMTEDEIRTMATGEVTEKEPYDPVTGIYKKGGLFDPALHGGEGHMRLIEEDEGLEVTDNGYGKNMSFISLPAYVLHPACLNDAAKLLGVDKKKLSKVIHCQNAYIVVDPGDSGKKAGDILTRKEYYRLQDEEKSFTAGMGAEPVKHLIESLHRTDHPERMFLKAIPVLPPVVRPVYFDRENKGFVYDPIQTAYKKVIERAARFRRLEGLDTPEFVMENDKALLQKAVDVLFYGGSEITGKRIYGLMEDIGWPGQVPDELDRALRAARCEKDSGYRPAEEYILTEKQQEMYLNRKITRLPYIPEFVYVSLREGTRICRLEDAVYGNWERARQFREENEPDADTVTEEVYLNACTKANTFEADVLEASRQLREAAWENGPDKKTFCYKDENGIYRLLPDRK